MIQKIGAALLAVATAALAPPAFAADKPLPIVMVHGNGDTAGLWITTMWRFESNGYPRELLHAVDLRYPLARSADDKPQPGRSSSADVMKQLAEEVADVRQRTGADKVVLIASSRGGNTVRNYLKNGGGAANTELAILSGATNHGVIVSDDKLVGSEFNGNSAFMRDLNSTEGEVVPGVRFVTIRSAENDKFAQPDGKLIGFPGVPTGVGFEGPELKGATNIVIPKVDHREVAFGPEAFAIMYRTIVGRDPATLKITPEASPVLNGKISGFEAGSQTNIGVAGAKLEIYKVGPDSGERLGGPAHTSTTGPDGMWGPFTAEPDAYYEFVVAVPGFPVTHIYRSPFPRSSDVVNLRPQQFGKTDKDAEAVVYMSRPRGYFGIGRDTIALDGVIPPEITPGVPNVSSAKRSYAAEPQRTVMAVFNDEKIPVRTWPTKDNHVSVAEFTY